MRLPRFQAVKKEHYATTSVKISLSSTCVQVNQSELKDKKEVNDPNLFISKFEGKEYYALRTHLGLVSDHAKELIEEKNFPEWLIKYPSMFPDSKKEYNPEEYLINLTKKISNIIT